MHALATLFLTKVPVETGCQPIIVSVVQKGCFSFGPLVAALPLSKSPLAGPAVAGRCLCARPPEAQVSEKSGSLQSVLQSPATSVHSLFCE